MACLPTGPATLAEHLNQVPLSRTQWLTWGLAAAGKFLEGLIVFIAGLVLPLLDGALDFGPWQRGAVAAAGLVGILLGSVAFGGLADRWGRRPVFIAEMGLLLIGLLIAGLSPSAGWLIAGLLIVGLALGADYPTAHLVIAESCPAQLRGRLVLGAFSFQALGVVSGNAVVSQVLRLVPQPEAWRLFYLLPVLPVLLLTALRTQLPESSLWLLSQGEQAAAEAALSRLLERPGLKLLPSPSPPPSASMPWPEALRALTSPGLRRATSLAALPWFLQDLATYGIGMFLPLLLSGVIGVDAMSAMADPVAVDQMAARISLSIDLALLAGFAVAIAGTDRWGRIPLQILGFLGCATGLLLAAAGAGDGAGPQQRSLLLAGVLLFQFMTNLGPNAQTYLLAGELFPAPLRGFGAGLAAAAGKGGAVLTALLTPVLLDGLGARWLLPLLALTSLLGALITWLCRQDTTSLDWLVVAPADPSR